MATFLAADIGGTKTILRLFDSQEQVLLQHYYVSAEFADFESLLADFFSRIESTLLPIRVACFAVAGPVNKTVAHVTNLPWQLDAERLRQKWPIQQVELMNDFAAVAAGIAQLTTDDLRILQTGDVALSAPRAVIGAGTGLGQAYMTPDANGWQVWATEGGHTDFAPADAQQQALLASLWQRWPHVSNERLVSGAGLQEIYAFLAKQYPLSASLDADRDAAMQISELAHQDDPLSKAAMALFVQLYAAQAGNLALTIMPRGGLFLAGGIVAKNHTFFETGDFIKHFQAKGRMQPIMAAIPVYLILQQNTGLLGAAMHARQSAV
ncbi:Glucokinase [Methylophaga frappieri]|uniref:Glucokinase n=1 Tax=Methylophaga frappieri (strain ATCC BAA-2434 / DSM 25690 / JAM7) TaxID=754477 RepID=I1YHN6_METFJ|nr:glucokinase [Methylophaga frappieri]AFJ02429.1 Glucokinase [Methylophaga frappieri]